MSKTGPTYLIPRDRARNLAKQIDTLRTDDVDLIALADHLRNFDQPLFYICVAEEDSVLWPGGPDIRTLQLGEGKNVVELVLGDELFSNQPVTSADADNPETTKGRTS